MVFYNKSGAALFAQEELFTVTGFTAFYDVKRATFLTLFLFMEKE
jgi:hypothetical protein